MSLFNSAQSLTPNMIELHGGLHIPQAILGNVARTAFANKLGNLVPGDALAFWRGDSKGFAVEIEVESAGCPVSAPIIKRELLGQITMRLRGVAVTEPVLP